MTAHDIDTASGKNPDTENFPVGSFLIRANLRSHIHVFYRFARAADDVSDHAGLSPDQKIAKLERFAVTLLDDKCNEIPSAVDLRKSLRETGVSPRHSLDLLTAFKRDAMQLRYRDWYDLIDYCNFSAAPVGRHVLELHGIGKSVWRANDALCNVLQIINHIQDCSDDYKNLNRVYIPDDMLRTHGASVEDLAGAKSTPQLRKIFDMMLDRMMPMMNDARRFPGLIPDARLKVETAVIVTLAERLISLLRKKDPLCDNVKLGKPAIFCATAFGVVRPFL